jgi:hypothetical protein
LGRKSQHQVLAFLLFPPPSLPLSSPILSRTSVRSISSQHRTSIKFQASLATQYSTTEKKGRRGACSRSPDRGKKQKPPSTSRDQSNIHLYTHKTNKAAVEEILFYLPQKPCPFFLTFTKNSTYSSRSEHLFPQYDQLRFYIVIWYQTPPKTK